MSMVSACAALALDFCARSEFSTLLRLMASVRGNSIIKPAVRAYTLYSGRRPEDQARPPCLSDAGAPLEHDRGPSRRGCLGGLCNNRHDRQNRLLIDDLRLAATLQ